MTQSDITKIFTNSNDHLIDITGFGNWLCRNNQSLVDNLVIVGVSDYTINQFKYCPFCGKKLNNNI